MRDICNKTMYGIKLEYMKFQLENWKCEVEQKPKINVIDTFKRYLLKNISLFNYAIRVKLDYIK